MVDATRDPTLDDERPCPTIAHIGGEDRALLRSPGAPGSARSDAGTEAGVRTTSGLPPTPTCSGHKAQNLGGPGAEPPQRLQPRAVCHLARFWGSVKAATPRGRFQPVSTGFSRPTAMEHSVVVLRTYPTWLWHGLPAREFTGWKPAPHCLH